MNGTITEKKLGILFLLASVFLWGPGPVITKLALIEVPQFSLAFLRGLISTFIVFILFFKKGYFKFKNQDLPKMIFAGLCGSVFNLFFFFAGIKLTSATTSQMIFTLTPIITTVLAYFLLKEKIKLIQFIGVLIGLVGAIIVALREFFEIGNFDNSNIWGNFLIFLAAISWVGYILTSKKLSERYSPITITSFSFLVSFVVFLPLAIFENFQNSAWVENLGFKGIFGILYQGIFASVLAFLSYQLGLKLTSAFTAGVILYLSPLVTTLVAVPVLKEKITLPFLFGAFLIIIGSLIATQFEAVKNQVKRRFG